MISELLSKSNLIWLKDRTIFATIHGSMAYGTNIPTSDIDVKGCCIPPSNYFYGFLDNFEQAEFNDPDAVIYSFLKLMKLAVENNPNAVEVIFTEPQFHLIVDPVFQSILDNRNVFLSKKLRYTMGGFAYNQMRRLKTHKSWLLNPKEEKPTRSSFGLPDNSKLIPESQLLEIEAAVKTKLEEWNPDTTGMDEAAAISFRNKLYDMFVDLKINSDEFANYAVRAIGLNDSLMEAFKKERQYKTALKEYYNYQEWKVKRNRKRFEDEQKFHYDLKFAYHIVRLYTTCAHFLKTGEFLVKCPNAEFLKEIRKGIWTFDQLEEFAVEQDKVLEELYETSTIPREPNRKAVDQLTVQITGEYLERKQ